MGQVNCGIGLEGRSDRRSPFRKQATEQTNDLVQIVLGIRMLGEKVGGIHLAVDLQQPELLSAQALLHPQRVALQVPELTKPLSAANAQGGGRIGPDPDRQR